MRIAAIFIAALLALPGIAQAAPAQDPAYGTAFGYVPNDGRGRPINELLSNVRAAIFCNFVWRICQ